MKIINNKKAQVGTIKAKTERVRIAAKASSTIVGNGNNDAVTDKEKDDAIKSNLKT